MSLILSKSFDYYYTPELPTRQMLSSYTIGSSSIFIKDVLDFSSGSRIYNPKLILRIFNINPWAFGFLNSLDFTKEGPCSQLVGQVFKNSRKVFPTGSFQIKSLRLTHMDDEIMDSLMSCDPFGLIKLEILNPINLDYYYKIVSIISLEELKIMVNFNRPVQSKYLKKLDIYFSVYFEEGEEFDFSLFPSLTHLTIGGYEKKIQFSGKALSLEFLCISEIEAKFIEFPSVTELTLEGFSSSSDAFVFFPNLIKLKCISCREDFWPNVNFGRLQHLKILEVFGREYYRFSGIQSFPMKARYSQIEF